MHLLGLIQSRTTPHLAILMFLLCIISVRETWTQGPILIGFFILLLPGEERSSFWLLWDRTGCSNQLIFSIKCQTAIRFSPSKWIVSSVRLPLNPLFYCRPFQWENEKELLSEKFHSCFTKTPSFITEEAAVNTILTYKNKPAKDHNLIPAGLMF